jgi:hypothetical protein
MTTRSRSDSERRVAGLLEDPHRRLVPGEDVRLDAQQVVGGEGVRGHRTQRVGHDPPSPEPSPQPEADLRRPVVHVVAEDEADAAGGLAVHLDRPMRGRHLPRHPGEPSLGIRRRIRVGEPVAEIAPDLAVVRVADQRRGVAGLPRPEGGERQGQDHGIQSRGAAPRRNGGRRIGRRAAGPPVRAGRRPGHPETPRVAALRLRA